MSKKERQVKDQDARAVFDGPVKAQRGDIFKVLSMGTCVEYTDQIVHANTAYKEASKPKQMFKIMRGSGAVQKLYEEII